MNKDTFVDLILPVPLRQLFTYKVPETLRKDCHVGKRAVVQFGKKKIYSAIIKKVHQSKPSEHATKNILNIIDDQPIITETQFKFWDWMADYYMCSLGDVYKAALPAGLRLESSTGISYNEDFFENEADFDHLCFSAKETLILDSLKSSKSLSLNEINEILSLKNSLPHLKSLYEKGAIKIHEKLEKGFQAKTEKYIGLNPEIADDENLNLVLDKLKKAPKQFEALNSFLELSSYGFTNELNKISQSEFQKRSGSPASIIKELIKKNILLIDLKDVSRLEFSSTQKQSLHPLNKNQLEALKKIEDYFTEKDTVLLHGVTSSGKTEIYIHLIDKYLKKEKQVLYLLPEIALTSQIVERLKRVFGSKVGVYHSKYNDAERVETWQNIQGNKKPDGSKQYQIILGVRSSVFLPFKNLGLVIVDEEHENTFKQFNPAPRYQARDAAIFLANLHGAKTLLGSATPSVESYFNAKSGKFGLVPLDKRHLDIEMPEIIVSNIKEARRKKQMKSHFSPLLLENIRTALNQNEQIILFQNRRGFAPYVECHSCGWIPKCEHCDVSLTYHRHTNQLVCHYCGFSYTNLKSCPECKETDIRTRGFGTEKVEEDLKLMFPEVEIKRLDLDTSRGKKAHSKLIVDFENHNVDILVGTQMISKGLDFENVSLVGILDANQMLHFPDFRAYERSYQLMAQVGGRAGRKNKRGKVIIQTISPENPIIHFVKENDYERMFNNQLMERKQFKYPPFNRLISITLKHKNKDLLDKASGEYANWLKKAMKENVIGPEYPIVGKVFNLYLKSILIKIEKASLAAAYKKYIFEASEHLLKQDSCKSIQIVYDVDPY